MTTDTYNQLVNDLLYKARRACAEFANAEDEDALESARSALFSKIAASTNYVADHESRPMQMKFENGRRVWITVDGFLDADFGPLVPPIVLPTSTEKNNEQL